MNCQLPERVPAAELLVLELPPQAERTRAHATINVPCNGTRSFRQQDANMNAALRLLSMLFDFLRFNEQTRNPTSGKVRTYTTRYWHIKNGLE